MSNIKFLFSIIQIPLFLGEFGYRCASRSLANVVEKLVHGSFVSLGFSFDLSRVKIEDSWALCDKTYVVI